MICISTPIADSWRFTKLIVMIFCAIEALLGWLLFNTSTRYMPRFPAFIAFYSISKCISNQIVLKIPKISFIFITRTYLILSFFILAYVCSLIIALIITPLFIRSFNFVIMLIWFIQFVLLVIRRRIFAFHIFIVSAGEYRLRHLPEPPTVKSRVGYYPIQSLHNLSRLLLIRWGNIFLKPKGSLLPALNPNSQLSIVSPRFVLNESLRRMTISAWKITSSIISPVSIIGLSLRFLEVPRIPTLCLRIFKEHPVRFLIPISHNKSIINR